MVSLKSSMNFGMGAMKKRYDIATPTVGRIDAFYGCIFMICFTKLEE